MNRDATIVQVAILLIIIAIVGVAVLTQQRKGWKGTAATTQIAVVQEAEKDVAETPPPVVVDTGTTVNVVDPNKNPTERNTSDNINRVKQYFRYIAEKDYGGACSIMSSAKCNATKPGAIENFRREFDKLVNGYEYINIKDYGFVAPSGKEIVCVKYSYRYKDDPTGGLVSEVMSFYVDDVGGELKITDRVCEKKYKDGRGLRDCPIQANAEFCEGWVR